MVDYARSEGFPRLDDLSLSREAKETIKVYCWGLLYDPNNKELYQNGLRKWCNGDPIVSEQADQIFLRMLGHDNPIYICDVRDGKIVD